MSAAAPSAITLASLKLAPRAAVHAASSSSAAPPDSPLRADDGQGVLPWTKPVTGCLNDDVRLRRNTDGDGSISIVGGVVVGCS